jgi:hypothetical protein
MSRNNAPTSVLVTSGNQEPLPLGSTIDALSPGQIGFFDANTKVSIDGSTPTRDFFIAVGVDRTGSGTLEDVLTSAGQRIETKNVSALSFREHTAAQPMVVVVGGYNGECETDYGLKIEFRNQQIYRTQGNVQFTKTYAFRTDCCDECAGCPSGDANEVTLKLLEAIAADVDGLLTSVPVARQAITAATHGTSVDYASGAVMTIADVEALKTFNDGEDDEANHVFSNVQITSVPQSINSYCTVNLLYFHPRQTILIPSLVDGFGCKGNITVTQDAAFEEGNGYDIAQKEFHASGNQQNLPYVLSDTTGVPRNIEVFAVKTEKYDQFILEYDLSSKAGWNEYLNNLNTVIAIPNQDTNTRDLVAQVFDTLLDAMTVGFDDLYDDAQASNVGDNVVSPTTDIDDVETDGLA